jgi:hypothetical protein
MFAVSIGLIGTVYIHDAFQVGPAIANTPVAQVTSFPGNRPGKIVFGWLLGRRQPVIGPDLELSQAFPGLPVIKESQLMECVKLRR